MAGEWEELSLREAGVQLLDCDHKTPAAQNSGRPYIAIPQLKAGRIDPSDARRISEEDFEQWTRKTRPKEWDVVVSRRCNPGETAFVPPGFEFALGQNLVILRSNGERVFPPFLRWLLRSPAWWKQVNTFINVGAVFESLKCADIPKFRLPVPPLREQEAIACILGSLDDKIELNHRRRQTLEAMARAIFQSWFVDFDPVRAKAAGQEPLDLKPALAMLYPDRLHDSPLGPIPAGWSVRTLADVTSKIGSGATPLGGSAVYVDEGTVLIRSQNVHDNEFVWNGLAHITSTAAEELGKVAVQVDDVLFNITGDSILRTCVVDPAVLPARVNQHVMIVRAAAPMTGHFIHQYLVRPTLKTHLRGLDAGATRPAITKAQLSRVQILVPPSCVLAAFDQSTRSLFQRCDLLRRESRTLAALRDALVPRLVSGALRVTATEKAEDLI